MYSTEAAEKIKPEKKSGSVIQTHDRCDSGAALLPTEISSQLIPVDGEDMKRIYEIHIFELRNNILSK